MAELAADSEETRDLLQQAQGGDRAAFERLFARHRAYLRRVVELRLDPRMRPRLDASDVVQETQLEAYRRLKDYFERAPMPFRLWLRKTAHERLIMAHRHHLQAARRSVASEIPLPDFSSLQLARQLLAAGSTPSRQYSRGELLRKVQNAMAQLSETDREILVMRNLEGLSNQESAQVLELEPATASQRYGRALLRLRNLLVAAGLMGTES
jgi:RNA polymerase sigma-70 factor (ECF subfamily)